MSHIYLKTFPDGSSYFAAAAYFYDDGKVHWNEAGFGNGSSEGHAAAAAITDLQERRERARNATEAPTLNLGQPQIAVEPIDLDAAADLLNCDPINRPTWAMLTLRQKIERAMAERFPVNITYTSARTDERTTRVVQPLRFEGEGFKQKLWVLDGDQPKQFFIDGISAVELA